jgi:hypothetical protein
MARRSLAWPGGAGLGEVWRGQSSSNRGELYRGHHQAKEHEAGYQREANASPHFQPPLDFLLISFGCHSRHAYHTQTRAGCGRCRIIPIMESG